MKGFNIETHREYVIIHGRRKCAQSIMPSYARTSFFLQRKLKLENGKEILQQKKMTLNLTFVVV